MHYFVLFLCCIFWGFATFFNRLAVETISPFTMQAIVGMVYMLYVPIAFKVQGINPLSCKLSMSGVGLTILATFGSIIANILLYTSLKGSNHTGSSTMMISLYPVITLILSLVFLNEQLNLIKTVGILSMVIGAVLLSL